MKLCFCDEDGHEVALIHDFVSCGPKCHYKYVVERSQGKSRFAAGNCFYFEDYREVDQDLEYLKKHCCECRHKKVYQSQQYEDEEQYIDDLYR